MSRDYHLPAERPIPLDDLVLDRYVTGECTVEERARVERWLEQHRADAWTVETMRASMASAKMDTMTPDASAAAARLAERLGFARDGVLSSGAVPEAHNRQPAVRHPHGFVRRLIAGQMPVSGRGERWAEFSSLRKSLRACAALMIVAAGVTLLRFALSPAPTGHIGIGTPYTVYTTPPGQRARISLRDGTQVMLNVASTLEVPRDFGTSTRAVRLVGQATFDVAHAGPARQFIVYAPGTRVAVLGTTFGVRAYDANVRVAVQLGKVMVCAHGFEASSDDCQSALTHRILAANDVAIVDTAGGVRVMHDAALDADFAFATGRLVVHGAPLRDVIADLNRWYDVEIRLADTSAGNLALAGAFPTGSVEDLVQGLTTILKVHVERAGRVVTIASTPATVCPQGERMKRGNCVQSLNHSER